MKTDAASLSWNPNSFRSIRWESVRNEFTYVENVTLQYMDRVQNR